MIEEHAADRIQTGQGGAIKTSVPAFSNATRRLMSIVKIGSAVEKAVRPRSKSERGARVLALPRPPQPRARWLPRYRTGRFLPIATRRDILSRGANEADARCEPICLGNRDRCRSKAAFKVGGTGSSVASTIARALSKASSRVKARSRLPWTAADAQLDVARAGKPRAARIRAEPASQGLAVTNVGPVGASRMLRPFRSGSGTCWFPSCHAAYRPPLRWRLQGKRLFAPTPGAGSGSGSARRYAYSRVHDAASQPYVGLVTGVTRVPEHTLVDVWQLYRRLEASDVRDGKLD